MNSSSVKYFSGLFLSPDQISIVQADESCIRGLASRELIQPFDLETLRMEKTVLESHVEALHDLYQRVGERGREVGVVLSNEMVILKKIPIALGLEEEMIGSHINWEAEQFLLSEVNDYSMEYQKLPLQIPGGNAMYLVVLVRKQIIKIIRNLMGKVGLELKDIDVDIFSSLRTILANYPMANESTSVLIDVQRQYLVFSFIRYKDYYLSHKIYLGKAKAKSESTEIIESVKILKKELRRLIFGHGLAQEISDLDRIFLMGSELVHPIAEQLASVVTVPLEIVNPFFQTRVSESVSQSKEFNKFPERFVPSMGIVLKRIPKLKETST